MRPSLVGPFLGALFLLLGSSLDASPVLPPDVSLTADEPLNYRLPQNVRPYKYELLIIPDLDNWVFEGQVVIYVMTQEANVQEIVLLSNDITIHNIRVFKPDTPTVDLHKDLVHPHDPVTHKLTIPLNAPLEVSTIYHVAIEYRGNMKDDMSGFYRSTYMENGEEKRLGATQFQTTSTRRAIPCFDEPGFKAQFELKIQRKAGLFSLSNTKLLETLEVEGQPGVFLDVFKPTPFMSSYLLAFVVSEFTSSLNHFDQAVWARPEMKKYTEFGQNIGRQLLAHFSNYTAYDYFTDMEKLDMVAVPDNRAGGMENYGLITFRESYLLFSSDKTSAADQQTIAEIISHEQAHLWFGDLVTCRWWDTAWLNEGFARYHQYFSTNYVSKNYRLDLQFVVNNVQPTLLQDSRNNTNPMNHEVNTPAEISGHFGYLSYGKGASIIRMIENFMGSEAFQSGIRIYLKGNSMGSVVPEDLYWALNGETELDVTTTMSKWADQRGYPVLTVTMNAARTKATLTQKRFILEHPGHSETEVYPIPITFTTRNRGPEATTPVILLDKAEGELEVGSVADTWITFNTQQVGYYRVNYDADSWDLIGKALQSEDHGMIHELNRAQVVDDALNLARGGLLDYQTAFDLLDFLPEETNYIPWVSAMNGLSFLGQRLGDQHSELFGKYVKKIMGGVYERRGFETKTSDVHIDHLHRAKTLEWLCRFQHEDCVAQAKEDFRKAKEDESHVVNKEIRKVVYCVGVRHGGKEAYEWLWAKYQKEDFGTEVTMLLEALGCVEDEEALEMHLGNIFSTALRNQDKSSAFSWTHSSHEKKVDKVLGYIKKNHVRIVDNLGSYSSLANYVSGLAALITREDQLKELEGFIATFGADAQVTLENAVKSVQYALYWDSKYLAQVVSIVEEKSKGGAATVTLGLTVVLVSCAVVVNSVLRI